MASGKSVVGEALSRLAGMPLVDADDEVARRGGRPIPQIFQEDGEAAFRDLERRVIADLCAGTGQVIAAGGGAFVDPDSRALMLASGVVFCLSARPKTILKRLSQEPRTDAAAGGCHRPADAGRGRRQVTGRIAAGATGRRLRPGPPHHRDGRIDAGAGGQAHPGGVATVIARKWEPITRLAPDCEYDFAEIDSLRRQWLSVRQAREEANPKAYSGFLDRLTRSWAIETGIIEGLYTLDRGVTETLVMRGISEELIEQSSTNKDPGELVRMLRDHQDAAEGVHHEIREGRPISRSAIRQIHSTLTRNQPTYRAARPIWQFV